MNTNQTAEFLESKRRLIDENVSEFIKTNLKRSHEVSYEVNAQGDVVGGRAWVEDLFCHYCVTDKFIFTTNGDAVVLASTLFSDSTQDALVAFFSDQLQSKNGQC